MQQQREQHPHRQVQHNRDRCELGGYQETAPEHLVAEQFCIVAKPDPTRRQVGQNLVGTELERQHDGIEDQGGEKQDRREDEQVAYPATPKPA